MADFAKVHTQLPVDDKGKRVWVDIEIKVDLVGFYGLIAKSAYRNKTKRTRLLNGIVTAKIFKTK